MAIDISIILHQFSVIKNKFDFIKAIFRVLCKLAFLELKPIFVFDGPSLNLKKNTIKQRFNELQKNSNKIQENTKKILARKLLYSVFKEKDTISEKEHKFFKIEETEEIKTEDLNNPNFYKIIGNKHKYFKFSNPNDDLSRYRNNNSFKKKTNEKNSSFVINNDIFRIAKGSSMSHEDLELQNGQKCAEINQTVKVDSSTINHHHNPIKDSEIVIMIKALLLIFGFSFIVASSEAEAQCAYLQKNFIVEFVITEDSDSFLFGATKVCRNFFSKSKDALMYHIKGEISQDDFCVISILLGNDYFDGVNGIGPKKAMNILTELKTNKIFKYCEAIDYLGNKYPEINEAKQFLQGKIYSSFFNPIIADYSSTKIKGSSIEFIKLKAFLGKYTNMSSAQIEKEVQSLSKLINLAS